MNPSDINSLASIKTLDSQNMYGSIKALSLQVREVRALAKKFKLPANYQKVKNIVIAGMGGSTLGAHVIQVLYKKSLKIPLEIANGYTLPAYVGKDTLVIGASYSGTTEEPLNALVDAKKRGAKIAVICSGGAMSEWAKKNKVPALVFTTTNNPCNSPRMGTGYTLIGELLILASAKLVKVSPKELDQLEKSIDSYSLKFGAEQSVNNIAKDIARAAQTRTVWYFGAEHLVGNAHIAANQMNENAKRFAGFFAIPELNHHLMEGMMQPQTNKENLLFVLLESPAYDQRIQKRFSVTKEIFDKNNIKYFSYQTTAPAKLSEVGELIALSSHVSFYAALLAGIDPTAIPFVDFFKAALKK